MKQMPFSAFVPFIFCAICHKEYRGGFTLFCIKDAAAVLFTFPIKCGKHGFSILSEGPVSFFSPGIPADQVVCFISLTIRFSPVFTKAPTGLSSI